MAELPSPYEIYEWVDGKTERWTILRWEEGELEIQLRTREGTKVVKVLRIHLPPEEKEFEPHYWDLTSSRLVHQLRGILDRTTALPLRVEITAIGRAPRTHFSVSPVPERPA